LRSPFTTTIRPIEACAKTLLNMQGLRSIMLATLCFDVVALLAPSNTAPSKRAQRAKAMQELMARARNHDAIDASASHPVALGKASAQIAPVIKSEQGAIAQPKAKSQAMQHSVVDTAPSVGTSERSLVTPVSQVAAKILDGDYFSKEQSFDAELMSRADQVQEKMQALKGSDSVEGSHKKAALAARLQESDQDRATRFFAAHGMKQIAHILGDEVRSK